MTEQRSAFNAAPSEPLQAQMLVLSASEILTALESKLDALGDGSAEAQHIAHELQLIIDEVKQALRDAVVR